MSKLYFAIFLFLFSHSYAGSKAQPMEDWKKLYESGQVVGLDVRSSLELKINPAPGAENHSYSSLDAFIKNTKKTETVFVFCESGGRAGRAKKTLDAAGFKKVINIGDWRTWNKIRSKNNPIKKIKSH